MSGTVTRKVLWQSSNHPTLIAAGTVTSCATGTVSSGVAWNKFSYAPDRSRYQQQTGTGGTTSTTTVYVGGLFEKTTAGTTTDYLHYIRGSGGVVATFNRNITGGTTTDTTEYWHRDHLGNVVFRTNASGNVVTGSRVQYDAWGKPLTGTLAKRNRGYTGHEHLSSLGLIHMNGRVYDPEVGRFLSPDTFVQFPESTQGFNRYTYVGNNPLSYSDPSGHFSLRKALGATAMIGMQFVAPGIVGAMIGNAIQGYLTTGTIEGMVRGAATGIVSWMVTPGLGGAAAGSTLSNVYKAGMISLQQSDADAAKKLMLLNMGTGAYINETLMADNVGRGIAAATKAYANAYVRNEYVYPEIDRFAAKNGMSRTQFNLSLMAASGLGNLLTGSRFREGDYMVSSGNKAGANGIEGFLSRSGGLITNQAIARGVGFFFDVNDTLLAYQGIPTASGWHALIMKGQGHLTGHSLGSLDVMNLYNLGFIQSARMEALPFGNIAASNNVIVQRSDPVSGAWLWWLTNPDASSFDYNGEGTCIHTWDCGFGGQ